MELEQVDSHLLRPWQEAIVAARDNSEDAGGKGWQESEARGPGSPESRTQIFR